MLDLKVESTRGILSMLTLYACLSNLDTRTMSVPKMFLRELHTHEIFKVAEMFNGLVLLLIS